MKWPYLILISLIAAFWILATLSPHLDSRLLLVDGLLRLGMNGIFVLALVPPLRAGLGINFGLPLGFIGGLVGVVTAMEFRHRGMVMAGWGEFGMAFAIAIPVAAVLGFFYALLLDRVKGQELMVGFYVGLAAVAALSIFWLMAPYRAPELIYPVGGAGLKSTIPLDGHFDKILDRLGWELPGGGPARPGLWTLLGTFIASTKIPFGLLLAWLLAALALAGFLRTRAGLALGLSGANPRFAHLAGAEVARMQRVSIIVSTLIAALGMIVFTQSLGLVQLYKAPLGNTLPAVAALLIGGATLRRASVWHAVLGVTLFQLLLVISSPVVNDLVQRYAAGREGLRSLENLPDILRVLILNGFILYALTRGGKEASW